MSIKTKQILELVGVLIATFAIIIVFVMLMPYVASLNVAIPIIILFELSPYMLMVGLVIMVCKMNKRSVLVCLGLKKNHITKQLLIAVVIFAITISFIIIPLLCGVNKGEVLSFKARSPLILIYYILKSIIFIGLGEELVWRGYFYERLKEITGIGIWAVVISSVLFGLFHYPNGQNILQVIMTSGIGFFYGFARLKIKDCSTLATGIAHGLHDAVILILSYILL